jgi:exopolyphosphatase/guanosine-5'-triphosphate,3'-diphosphate pyrophosphatase
VHHRYTKSPPKSEAFGDRLLSEEQRRSATALGLAMRLGADVSGRAVPLLDRFRLRRDGGELVLSAGPGGAELLTEQAVKRLEPLALALGLVARVEPG